MGTPFTTTTPDAPGLAVGGPLWIASQICLPRPAVVMAVGCLLMSAATSADVTSTPQFVDSQSATDCGVTVPVDVQAERNNAVTNRMAFIAALFWNRLNVRASCMSSMGHEQMHRLSGSKIHQSSTSSFACSTVPRTMSSGECDGLSGIAFRRQNPLVASIQPPVFGGSRVLPAFLHSNLMKSSHHKIRD